MLRNLLKTLAISITLLTVLSFKSAETSNLKQVKPFVGIWNVVANPENQIVIKSDGSFYAITKQNELRTITHSGHIKILSDNMYSQEISYALANSIYDLKDRQYVIQYLFSKDKQTLKQSGFVDAKNGGKGVSWSEELVKTDHIN